MLFRMYYEKVKNVLDNVIMTQANNIIEAANHVANCIENDGIIYVFGCGHSHLIGEDLFYRAGGLSPVCAMFDSSLMLHEGAVKSSYLERTPGLAKHIFERYHLNKNDLLIVVSTSGINSVPIEMAQHAQNNGNLVISITSSAYKKEHSRHMNGKLLSDYSDVIIDNCIERGDAAIRIGGSSTKAGPISTISNSMIAQCLVVQASQILWDKGIDPPIYVSGNVDKGIEKNKNLIDKYKNRIIHL